MSAKKQDAVTRAAYVKNKTLPVSLILYAALLDQEIRWKTKKTLKNTIKAHSFDSFDWSQTNQKSFSFNHPIPPPFPTLRGVIRGWQSLVLETERDVPSPQSHSPGNLRLSSSTKRQLPNPTGSLKDLFDQETQISQKMQILEKL